MIADSQNPQLKQSTAFETWYWTETQAIVWIQLEDCGILDQGYIFIYHLVYEYD